MHDYIVYLYIPTSETPFQAFTQCASNPYSARRLAMYKHCKKPVWWVVKLNE